MSTTVSLNKIFKYSKDSKTSDRGSPILKIKQYIVCLGVFKNSSPEWSEKGMFDVKPLPNEENDIVISLKNIDSLKLNPCRWNLKKISMKTLFMIVADMSLI